MKLREKMINEILQTEGLSEKFLEYIKKELNTTLDSKQASNASDDELMLYQKSRLIKEILKGVSTRIKISILLEKVLSILPNYYATESDLEAIDDLSEYERELLLYFKVLKAYNKDIIRIFNEQEQPTPSMIRASEVFVTGIIISMDNCIRTLNQKVSIVNCISTNNTNITAIFPEKRNNIVTDRKVLKEGYELIKEKHQTLSKTL